MIGPVVRRERRRKRLKATKDKNSQQLSFYDLVYPIPTSSTGLTKKCVARANTSAQEDYTPVFLGHARLYTIADKYKIEALRSMVLNELHGALRIFTLYEDRYGDIVDLLRFTYKNTPDRTQIDPLRGLVVQYITCEAKPVTHTEHFLSLVEEGGQLARDLFTMLTL